MDFYETFMKELETEIEFGPIHRYALLRINQTISHFVFVEGASDQWFYSNTKLNNLNNPSNKYIYRYLSDIKYQEYKGKEAVLFSYYFIKKNIDKLGDLEKCIFIIDRDFDDGVYSDKVKLTTADRKKFAITSGHSMENFFLLKNNIHNIFRLLNIAEKEEHFLKLFNDFSNEVNEFYALKGTITWAYKEKIYVSYRKNHDFDDIFSFVFNDDEFSFRRDWMQEEIKSMRVAIQKNSQLRAHFEKLYQKIRSDHKFIRGHDVFNFLNGYLKQSGCNMIDYKLNKEEYSKIVSSFFVELSLPQ